MGLSIVQNSLKINQNEELLHPTIRRNLNVALEDARANGLPLKLFEGWRSPRRQDFLYSKGRGSDKGQIITNKRAWESWHQYGMAVDVVFFRDDQWDWNGEWDKVEAIFIKNGFTSLKPYERNHFQITPPGMYLKDAKALMALDGVLAVWDMLES